MTRLLSAAPLGPSSDHRTYRIQAPLSTHFRPATCAEINCPEYLNGWRIHKEALSPVLLHTATTTGRKYKEVQVSEGRTYLVYEAGQTCFQVLNHRTRVERPELYIVRDGRDAPRLHQRAEDWSEDLHEHTDRINDARNKG